MSKHTKCKVLGLLGVCILIAFSGCGKKNMKLQDYVVAQCNGYEGFADASVTFDSDAFEKDAVDKKVLKAADAKKYAESVELEVTNNGSISTKSGIKVKATVDSSIDKDGLIKTDDITVAAKGLKATKEYDVFSQLNVRLEGISPKVRIVIDNNSTDEYVKSLSIVCDKNGLLKEGDKAVVRIDVDEKEEGKKGISFKKMSQEFVVGDINSYPDGAGDLSSKDIEPVVTICKDTISQHTSDTTKHMLWRITGEAKYLLESSDEKAENITLSKVYYVNEKSYAVDRDNNYLYLVFSADISNGTSTEKGFFMFECRNVYLTPDKKVCIVTNGIENMYICGNSEDELYKSAIGEKEDAYTVSEIKMGN